MDRAIDPQLLLLALGQHENLPSPEQLSELLAEAELNLLLQSDRIPEQLEAVGWYLHGVASSRLAPELYGIERQRAAFQVSAHVFDLLLHRADLQHLARLKYCFASQISYLRSDLNPNALAIYRRIHSELGNLRLLEDFGEIALACGVAFLGMDTRYVFDVTRNLRDEVNRLVPDWEVQDIFSTPFGSAAGVALGVRDLTTFLVFGRSEMLESARERLRAAVVAENCQEDQLSRWVAAHLLNLTDDLENSSIWTVLPPDVPPNVRTAFAMGTPKVLTLWPPQLQLFELETNPLSSSARRLLLSTPTSAGKTLLAQLLILSHLATSSTSVCYVAPTRSLCREIRKSLDARLRLLHKQVIDSLPEGDWLDSIVNDSPDVEIMTPERLSYLMRADSEQLLSRYGMFIFDEVHLIGEAGRGWTLEEELTYLHFRTADTEHRLILISAVIGNRNHFVQWMGEEVIHSPSDWRGPRRLHAIWTTEFEDWNNPIVEPMQRSKKYTHRAFRPLVGRLDVRISHTGRTFRLRTSEPIGNYVRKFHSSDPENIYERDSSKSTPFYKMLFPIIEHLAAFGPVLVIESTRPGTMRLAKTLADHLPPANGTSIQPLVDLVEARLGSHHPLKTVLQHGVAYHHGSLPSEIREAIEDAVIQGDVAILVATTTMTEGVNLPVRSVVIASQGSYGDDGYVEYITGPKLINAVGRAGRATKETEGIIVLARNEKPTAEDFGRLSPNDSDLDVISMLAAEDALASLAEFEQLQRASQDAVFEAGRGAVSDFIRFVWFVASELEKIGRLVTQENVVGVLQHSFGWTQLTTEAQDRWISVAEHTRSRYMRTNPQSRRRWASAGTSISSAWGLEQIAENVVHTLLNTEVPQEPLDAIKAIIAEDRLDKILALPEAPQKGVFDTRGGAYRTRILVPMRRILMEWLQGADLITLASTFFGEISDIEYRFEQLGDYLNQYFEVFLPWVMATLVPWTNELLEQSGSAEFLPTAIPAYVRWGVGNSTALELMVAGIQSRTLALRIATQWEIEEGDVGVREWIQSMNVDEWRTKFDASVADLRNLLEFCRNPQGDLVSRLIFGEVIETKSISFVDFLPKTSVSLKLGEGGSVAPVEIWAKDTLVGQVSNPDRADILSILNAGLTIETRFSVAHRSGILELILTDPGS